MLLKGCHEIVILLPRYTSLSQLIVFLYYFNKNNKCMHLKADNMLAYQ